MQIQNIACDQDDTMWPVIKPFLVWYKEKTDIHIRLSQVTTFEIHNLLKVAPNEVYDLFMEFYCSEAFIGNRFFKGSTSCLSYWNKQGCKIFNPTSKPDDPKVVEATEAMLAKVPGVIEKVFYLGRHCGETSHGKKVDVCREIKADVCIDDHEVNLLAVAEELGIPCILRARPWNESFDTNPHPLIAYAYDWTDIHSILFKIAKGEPFRINENTPTV